MHRAPTISSRRRENAKKDRTCGKQVLNVFTTFFKPAEQPVHQNPISRVPMHEISALFAPQLTHEAIPGSQNSQAIPIKSLHDISPLFPRRIDHTANPTPRSQGEYPSPQNGDKLLMPQYPSLAMVCPPRRPVANTHDSFLVRAKCANLEPVLGGEADEYYRSFRPESIKCHNDVEGIPIARPDSQQRPFFFDCSSSVSKAAVDSDYRDDVATLVRHGVAQHDPVLVEATTHKSMTAQLCSVPASETPVDSDWRDDVAALIRRGLVHPAVLDEAPTRKSMTAELCYASDSENDGDDEDSLCEPPRRDSFSVYEASSSTQSEGVIQELTYVDLMVSDPEVQAEWSALMMRCKDQAYPTYFVHHWENSSAEPVNQSLFADFDGDFTQGVLEQSLFELSADCEIPRPASDHWVPRPNITRFDSLPTADRLCDVFLKRNAEHPDTESHSDMQPEIMFRKFYKFRTGRSF
jgi:hypothetical protein